MRKSEYFNQPKRIYVLENVVMFPKVLFTQERDWTCSIACLRSITYNISGIGSEEYIINRYGIRPGPIYSNDIKRMGILNKYSVKFGCDYRDKSYDIQLLYDLLSEGYYVMVESMICFDHWLVLCAYLTNNNTLTEKQDLLLYDPYYNKLHICNVDEFESMWMSGEYASNNVIKDFIAVK